MSDILIVGANGALGSALLQYYHAKKKKVIGLVRPNSNENLNFDNIIEYTDYKNVDLVLKKHKPKLIINAAGKFRGNLNELYEANVALTGDLLEAVELQRLECKVVIVGSAAEYGVSLKDINFKETDAINPINMYGLSKVWQTQLANYYHLKGVNVFICRVFNISGKNTSEVLLDGKINMQIQEIKSSSRMNIEVNGSNDFRDYLEMELVVENINKVIEKGKFGEIYNIGSGKKIRIEEYIKEKLRKVGLENRKIIFTEKYNRDPNYSVANTEKINLL